jgi:hypothetical protein
MKKVFQTVVDPNKGNCMQAVIASLFDKELEEVPNFIECEDWFKSLYEFIQPLGYDYHGMFHNKNYSRLLTPTFSCFNEEVWHAPSILTRANLKKYKGVNGYFFASVLSPKYFNYKDGLEAHTHAVIVDVNCNVVHDPNPEYKGILEYPLAKLLKYNGIIDVFDISKK